jgi:hypothetical protein
MPELHQCTKQGCTVLVDGKCINSLALNDCDDYRAAILQADGGPTGAVETTPLESLGASNLSADHLFPSGSELPLSQIPSITQAHQTAVVMVAGQHNSGKSTLILSIYDKFRKSVFEEYSFAGSETIYAFEDQLYASRIESENLNPQTDHTPSSEEPFFHHLALVKDAAARRDLLLSNLHGEQCRAATDSNQSAKFFACVSTVDQFVILLDGDKLVDVTKRNLERKFCVDLLDRLLSLEYLHRRSNVQIIFSKWDVVLEAGTPATQFCASVEEMLLAKYASSFAGLKCFRIVARHLKNVALTQNDNLIDLLRNWLRDPVAEGNIKEPIPLREASTLRSSLASLSGGAPWPL